MARVNISKQLKDDVVVLCSLQRNKEIGTLGGPAASHAVEQITYDAERIEHVFFHEAAHLHHSIPDSWLTPIEKLYLHVYDSDEPFVGAGKRTLVGHAGAEYSTADARCSRKLRVPNTYGGYTSRLNVSLGNPIVRPYREAFKTLFAYQKARLEIQNKWNEVIVQVHDFLDSQPSLNTALKKWEGLAHFIPEKYLRKVEEAVTRRVASSDEDAVQIDTTRLEVVAVTAKLIGA